MVSLDQDGGLHEPFRGIKQNDEERHSECRTERVILDIHDAMAEAFRSGHRWDIFLGPAPADASTARSQNGVAQ